jgi:HAD superfamily phosphatase
VSERLIVFDVDGVLVDVTESYRESIVHTVRHFTGRETSRDVIQDFKNRGGWNNDWELSHKLITDAGVAVDYEQVVDHFKRVFFGNGAEGLVMRERWLARPGLLEGLSRRYRFAIFTGRYRDELDVTVERFAKHLRFDPIITADMTFAPKPSPDGLLEIAREVPDAEIWYVGDSVDDARSGKAAGVRFIGIASPAMPWRDDLARLLQAEGAIAVLDDINGLEAVLS